MWEHVKYIIHDDGIKTSLRKWVMKGLNALFVVQVELPVISTALVRRRSRRESRNLNMMRKSGRFFSDSFKDSNRTV
jgi:hypothetical protein